MKIKQFLILGFFYSSILAVSAKTIDPNTAQAVARNFLQNKSVLQKSNSLQLTKKVAASSLVQAENILSNDSSTVCYYIYSGSVNFVIVSATDNVAPILGYSNERPFNSEQMPENLRNWLEMYKNQIQYAIDNNIAAADTIQNQWKSLLSGQVSSAAAVVAPMIKTTWNQAPYYNDLCPFDNALGKYTLAGCGAVAMAQVLKYWNYPTVGIGSHSYVPYTNPQYGTLSADFQHTTYNWSSMPNSISSANTDVATLIYHCGVSLDMDYGVDNSNAYHRYNNHPSTYLALKDFFGYKSTLYGLSQSSYTTAAWTSMIKTDLDAGRPVLYRGSGNDGGHLFVCDGYDANDYFHFNWGWNGYYDGYFALSALSPGTMDFSSGQYAIFGIEPETVNPTVDIHLNSKLAISPAVQIKAGQAFSITANVKNCGGASFTGVICAGLFNSSGTLMTTFGSQTVTLNANSTTGSIVFSTTGISTMTAGSYSIHLMHKQNTKTSYTVMSYGIDLAGTYNNTLPVTVSASAYSLLPDAYETNDTETTASVLGLTFVNDTARIVTTNTNLHTLADVDYYTVNLPSGYHYSVSSYLISPLSSSAYTGDVKYSYKAGNASWSLTANYDLLPFESDGNENVYFKVEPFGGGNPGTYALSATIIRKPKPNLKPYMPSGWDDVVVVNKTKGELSSASHLTTNDSVYINVAHTNIGTGSTNKQYYSPVFLDGNLLFSWNRSAALSPNYYTYYKGFALGKLSEGVHTIKLEVDATSQIDETNETDNEYVKTFTVYAPSLTASPNEITIPCTESNTLIDIKSSLSWTVECPQQWISFDKAAGSLSQTVNVHVLPNSLSDVRSANIVFTASDNTSLIVILTQQGQNTAIETVKSNDFIVYPNPSNGKFVISVPENFGANSTMTLMDINAKQIKQFNLSGESLQQMNLDVPAGIYNLELNNGTKRVVNQIIICK
jgi:CARDB./Peptidase C10 family.